MWQRSLFRLKERLVHPHLSAALDEMARNDRLSRPEFLDVQDRLIVRTLRQAAKCPYYARLFEQKRVDVDNPRSLAKLPLLTKQAVQAHRQDLVNAAWRGKLEEVATSGSTGTPGRFYRTRFGQDWGYGSAVRSRQLWDLDPAARTIRLWGRSGQFNRSWLGRLRAKAALWKNRPIGILEISAYNLSQRQIRRRWPEMVGWKPEVINGYVTAVYLLAQFVRECGLDGRALGLSAVIVEAEKLYGFQRDAIREVFGCPVLELYGCSEIGVIAGPCPKGKLHVREDFVHLEIVDGAIVVTTLREPGMPLLRYVVGDEGTLADGACGCGLPTAVLADIQGRTHDLIRRVDGGFVHGEIFSHILERVPDVRRFRVVQRSVAEFDVLTEPAGAVSAADRNRVTAQFRDQLGGDVVLDFRESDAIETEASGKFRWVASEVETG